TLRLLELAAGGEPQARALAVAAAARLRGLLEDLPDRTAAETRTLALPRAGLPWPAQAELAEIGAAIARRRVDAALLAAESRRARGRRGRRSRRGGGGQPGGRRGRRARAGRPPRGPPAVRARPGRRRAGGPAGPLPSPQHRPGRRQDPVPARGRRRPVAGPDL